MVSIFEEFVPSLREYYHWHCESYQAGGLGDSIEAWKQLTPDKGVLRDISGVHIPHYDFKTDKVCNLLRIQVLVDTCNEALELPKDTGHHFVS